MLFVTGFMTLFKLVLPWVFYVSAALSVLTTLFFIIDIEEELKLSKRRSPDYDSSAESSEEE
jgi:hypothetical protein